MNKITTNLVLLILFGLSLPCDANKMKQQGFEYTIAPTGDWITTVEPKLQKKVKDGINVSWLLSDNQLKMTAQEVAYFSHYAVTVNSESGLKDVSEFSIYFQPDFQTLDINFVKRHRKGKIENVTKQADIRLLQREESYSSGIYDGGVTAILLLKDVQVGDTIEYAYTINGRNPIFGQEYFAGFSTSWSIPVGRTHIKYLTDKPMFHQVVGDDENHLKISKENGLNRYSWNREDSAVIYDEGEYPHWYNPYGVVRFSQYESWEGVVDWALELYSKQEINDPDLLALAKKWSETSKSKKEYAEKVVKYAQNSIRYFGIEIGQNSHLPYDPDTVFKRKFGDCKDKATLINTLLAMEDIPAYPALVSSRTGKAVKDRIPQPGAFDHVISTFTIDGKEYWVDGTREFQFGALENIGVSNFQQALVIKKGETALTAISAKPKVEEITIEEVYTSKNYKDPVSLKVKFGYRYSQAERVRASLKADGVSNFSKGYKNYYARQYPQIELLENVKVEDDEINNKVEIYIDFKIPAFWKLEKSNYQVAMYGDLISSYIERPKVADRKMPLAVYYPIKLKHTVELNYGHELGWELDNKNLLIATDAIKYHRVIEPREQSVKVFHDFDILKDAVPTRDVKNHISKINEIREAIYYSVSIPERGISQKNNDLKNSIRRLLKRNR